MREIRRRQTQKTAISDLQKYGQDLHFTNKGQMHLLKVLDLPYGKFRDKGTPIDNLSNYNSSEENFVYITNLAAISHSQVLFGTKSAMLKVVDGSEFDVAKRTTAATKLNEGDELIFVQALALEETLVMQSERLFSTDRHFQYPGKEKREQLVCAA